MQNSSIIFPTPPIRLKIIRHALDIKQGTFAQFLQISVPTLRKWESVNFVFNDRLKTRLNYVGICPQWIEYGTGDTFSYDLQTVKKKIMFAIKQKPHD